MIEKQPRIALLIDADNVIVHHQQLFNGETSFWL